MTDSGARLLAFIIVAIASAGVLLCCCMGAYLAVAR